MCRYDEECSWQTEKFTCEPGGSLDNHPEWEHARSWEQVQAALTEQGHVHDRDGDPVTKLRMLLTAAVYTYAYDDDGDWATGDVTLDLDNPDSMLVPAVPPAPITDEEMAEVYAALGVSV